MNRPVTFVLLLGGALGGCKGAGDTQSNAVSPPPQQPSAIGAVATVSNPSSAAPDTAKGGPLSFLTGGGFEGEIAFTISDAKAGASRAMSYQIKGDKIRMDLPPHGAGAPTGRVILLPKERKMISLIEAGPQKLAMEMDLAKLEAEAAKNPKKAKLRKTGKSDVVAGYACETWEIDREDSKGEACMAEGVNFFMPKAPGGGLLSGWGEDLSDGKHFPLRVIGREASGAEKFRMEVTKVERRSIDDDRFTIPADYKRMDMSQMMPGLAGAMGGPPPGPAGGLPPGFKLPPGVKLPSGMTPPPGAASDNPHAGSKAH